MAGSDRVSGKRSKLENVEIAMHYNLRPPCNAAPVLIRFNYDAHKREYIGLFCLLKVSLLPTVNNS